MYSLAHALIWMLAMPANLMVVIVIMVVILKQVGQLMFIIHAHLLIAMTDDCISSNIHHEGKMNTVASSIL
jgi:hypothetical protein